MQPLFRPPYPLSCGISDGVFKIRTFIWKNVKALSIPIFVRSHQRSRYRSRFFPLALATTTSSPPILSTKLRHFLIVFLKLILLFERTSRSRYPLARATALWSHTLSANWLRHYLFFKWRGGGGGGVKFIPLFENVRGITDPDFQTHKSRSKEHYLRGRNKIFYPKIRMLCFVLINGVLLSLLCVWKSGSVRPRTFSNNDMKLPPPPPPTHTHTHLF